MAEVSFIQWLRELGKEFAIGTFVLLLIGILFLVIQGPLSGGGKKGDSSHDDPGENG